MEGQAEISASPVKSVAELSQYIREKTANKELVGEVMQQIIDDVVGWHNSLNYTSGMGVVEHGYDGERQQLMEKFKYNPFTGEELTQEQRDQSINEALSILNLVNQIANGPESAELSKLASVYVGNIPEKIA